MANLLKAQLARRTLFVAGVILACVLFGGCESMNEADALALGLAGMGTNAKTPEQAQSVAMLSAFASEAGRRQHELEVARAGRPQVNIINASGTSADSQASVGSIRTVTNLAMDNGGIYSGSVIKRSDGRWTPDGRGSMRYSNGDKYDGEWKAGMADGHGLYVWADGRRYDGEWKSGEQKGHGVKTFPSGARFDGEWKGEDFGDGRMIMYLPDGGIDDAVWRDGLPNGPCRLTLPNGVDLSGEMRDGHWWRRKGTDVGRDGTKYSGEWNQDGSGNGGTIKWVDGRIYEGEWNATGTTVPEGNGVLRWPDGRRYSGDFRDGRMHGYGRMTYADGRVEEGSWLDDVLVGSESQAGRSEGTIDSEDSERAGLVVVSADDESFEVFVDGSFVGNSPAKLKLTEGTHLIEVRKPGYRDYRREVKVTDGCELNLRAVLNED